MKSIVEYQEHFSKLLASSELEQVAQLNQSLLTSATINGVDKVQALQAAMREAQAQMGVTYTDQVHARLFPQLPLSGFEQSLTGGRWEYEHSIEEASADFCVKAAKYVVGDQVLAYFKPGPERLKRDSFLHNFVRFLQVNDLFPVDYNPFVVVQPYLLDLDKVEFTEEMKAEQTKKRPQEFNFLFDVTPSLTASVNLEEGEGERLVLGNIQPALAPLSNDENPSHLLLMLALCLLFEMRDIKTDALYKDYVLTDAEDFLAELDPEQYKDFPRIHLQFLALFAQNELPTPSRAQWLAALDIVKYWGAKKDLIRQYLLEQRQSFNVLTHDEVREVQKCLMEEEDSSEEEGNSSDSEEVLEMKLPGNLTVDLELNDQDPEGDFVDSLLDQVQVDRVVANLQGLVHAFTASLEIYEIPAITALPANFCMHWKNQVALFKEMLAKQNELRDIFRSSEYKKLNSIKDGPNAFQNKARGILRKLSFEGMTPEAMAGDRLAGSPTSAAAQSFFVANPLGYLGGIKRQPSAPKTTPEKRLPSPQENLPYDGRVSISPQVAKKQRTQSPVSVLDDSEEEFTSPASPELMAADKPAVPIPSKVLAKELEEGMNMRLGDDPSEDEETPEIEIPQLHLAGPSCLFVESDGNLENLAEEENEEWEMGSTWSSCSE